MISQTYGSDSANSNDIQDSSYPEGGKSVEAEYGRSCLEADPIIYDPFRTFQKDDPSKRIGGCSFRAQHAKLRATMIV